MIMGMGMGIHASFVPEGGHHSRQTSAGDLVCFIVAVVENGALGIVRWYGSVLEKFTCMGDVAA